MRFLDKKMTVAALAVTGIAALVPSVYSGFKFYQCINTEQKTSEECAESVKMLQAISIVMILVAIMTIKAVDDLEFSEPQEDGLRRRAF